MKKTILYVIGVSFSLLLSGCSMVGLAKSGDANNANKEVHNLDDVALISPFKMNKDKAYIVVVQPFRYQKSLFKVDKTGKLQLAALNVGGTDTIAVMEVEEGEHTYILDACFPASITVNAKNGYAYYITKEQSLIKQSFSQYCSGQGKLLLADQSDEKVKEYLTFDNYALNQKMTATVQNAVNNSSLPSHWKERNEIIAEVKPIFNVFVKANEGVKLD